MSLLFPWPSLNRFWLLLQAMETRGKEEELGKAAEGGCGQDREHSQAPLPTCPPRLPVPAPRASSAAQIARLSAVSTPPFPTQIACPALNIRSEQLSRKQIAGIGDSLHIWGVLWRLRRSLRQMLNCP